MKDINLYSGLVTFKFFDKEGNLKAIHKQHNRGTPYFFAVIEEILKNGVNTSRDIRPGKIMLTDEGEIEASANTIKIENLTTCLSSPIPMISRPNTSFLDGIVKKDNGEEIPYITPCIRYEFNISYYDLVSNLSQGIGNLDRYRFWLLSSNENMFKLNGVSIETDDSSSDIDNLLDHITYKNVVIEDKISKICAQVQLTEGANDTDYSLNEGEYITVLWDMYFQNINNN